MDLADRLFRRDCVTCPSTQPSCNCGEGQRCILTVKTCTQCPEARCVDTGSSSSSISGKSAGAIAGGVVGGLVGLGLIIGIFFWYKFRYRRRRHLQALNEAALEYDSPPQSPQIDYTTREAKPPSITSTYGGASRRSNVIPIMFPFSQRNMSGSMVDSINMDSVALSALPRDSTMINLEIPPTGVNGEPVIRDSIRDSEYSMQSDNQSVISTNQGVRAYDLAVQGIPNLIDVGRQGRRGQQQQQQQPGGLHMISENEPLGSDSTGSIGGAGSSNKSDRGLRASTIRSLSSRRRSRTSRNSFAELPDLPIEHSSKNGDNEGDVKLSSPSEILTSSDTGARNPNKEPTISPFDDSASVDNQSNTNNNSSRMSIASSTAYSAHLPEEARIYHGHGYL